MKTVTSILLVLLLVAILFFCLKCFADAIKETERKIEEEEKAKEQAVFLLKKQTEEKKKNEQKLQNSAPDNLAGFNAGIDLLQDIAEAGAKRNGNNPS